MSDFTSHIANTFPGAGEPAPKKAPPPLPAKKAPPLPPKAAAAMASILADDRRVDSLGFTVTADSKFDTGTGKPLDGCAVSPSDAADRLRALAAALPAAVDPTPPVIEKGFINPPDSPAVLAATPEEAVAVQGIVATQPPVADDLDGMTKAQLLSECEALGIPATDTKGKRETGLKKLVRDRRAEIVAVAKGDNSLTEARHAAETTAMFSAAREHADAELAAMQTETQEPEVTTKFDKPATFALYINCRPDGFRGLTQGDLVAECNRMIKEQSGHEDYRLVEYGKGVAYLGLAAKDAVERRFGLGEEPGICIDTRTPEGQALVTTLESLTTVVVRGSL